MEPQEAADQIQEAAEEEERKDHGKEHKSFNRSYAAIAIAVLALLLAVTSLAGGNVSQDITNKNILASDTWAFYQAKNIRQTDYKLAQDELELVLLLLPPDKQAAAQKKVDDYRATIVRYESEPDPKAPDDPTKGDGKKEISARATALEEERDHAQEQEPNFNYAEGLYQIAIVLGSVSIVAASGPLLGFALSLGALGTVLMLNGFFLFFKLPFGG